MKRITSVPLSLRPREKVLKYGPQALSIAELLAVIFVTGSKLMPVSTLATKLAKKLTHTTTITKNFLMELNLGPSKTAQILALLELSHRLNHKPSSITITKIEEIISLSHEIISANKEILLCFYLNARGELIKKETIAIGSLNRVNLLPREIYSVIKELPISAIILVHNHPSGNVEPSQDDLYFTKRVQLAGDILGVKLLDHIIVAKEGWKRIELK